MLESNSPGISNRRLISTMSEGVAARSRPLVEQISFDQQTVDQSLIGLMRLLIPKKTHASTTKDFACNRRLCSNSAGGRYPSAECKRFRL